MKAGVCLWIRFSTIDFAPGVPCGLVGLQTTISRHKALTILLKPYGKADVERRISNLQLCRSLSQNVQNPESYISILEIPLGYLGISRMAKQLKLEREERRVLL